MSDTQHLSRKDIPPRERLIVALDVDTLDEADALIATLDDAAVFYKLGLQLFMAGDYFTFVRELVEQGKKVFVDLKFFDVPETVGSAVRQLGQYGADFVTVHGNEEMLQAAVRERNGIKVLAVTVLTSLDQHDIKDLGFGDVDITKLVLSRARRALAAGCDGVISSGLEAADLRNELGEKFLIVAPGIRPVENRIVDDQKRVSSPEEAFRQGADYIVVGRPIRNAPDQRAAAEAIQETIARLFP
jgi:orotidine-5'-phosphate decarboxylase